MNEIRHPEKINKPSNPIPPKPKWIRVKAPNSIEWKNVKNLISSKNLVTVCEEASCPNIGECWTKKHATFMILGDTCTRACAFCNIKTGIPGFVDQDEPKRIAEAVTKMKLKHVVITSVDRDDLEDGGATQFNKTISEIRKSCPSASVEILTPDFLNKASSVNIILQNEPDVFNHNLETVPSLYNEVRPGARYFTSLKLLYDIKTKSQKIFTKSGIMVGLGETKKEIIQVMDDLRAANVDFLTIGQYLQPTIKHYPIKRFVTPEEFESFKTMAIGKGFLMVASSPLTRSSYHAAEDFKLLQQKRNKTK